MGRKKDDTKRREVLEGLKAGKDYLEISEDSYISVNYISRITHDLIQDGLITKEEIIQYKEYRKAKDFVESDAFKQILKYRKEGVSYDVISEKVNIYRNKISKNINNAIKFGLIGEADVENGIIATKRRAEKRKEEEKLQFEAQIVECLKKGMSQRQMEEKIGLDRDKIRRYIPKIKQKYNISDEQIAEWKKDKKEMKEKIEKNVMSLVEDSIASTNYVEALQTVKDIEERHDMKFSDNTKEKLRKLRLILDKAIRVEKAKDMINEGNTNTRELVETSGLSKDEINILKIKLNKERKQFFSVNGRNKLINVLIKNPTRAKDIQDAKNISDFEMQDVLEQVRCIRTPRAGNKAINDTKKDSLTRIIAMLLKFGKNKEEITNTLKLTSTELEEKINLALEAGLIEEKQLNGIDPLAIQEKLLSNEIERE